jgi:hypothetical protein
VSSNRIDLYNTAYAHYANDVEAAVRKETYGEDIGQSSWITAAEWLRFARRAALQEWWRVLHPGRRMLFTDAMAVTGLVSHEELATRSSIGGCVHLLSAERRLSGFSYLAAKPLPS